MKNKPQLDNILRATAAIIFLCVAVIWIIFPISINAVNSGSTSPFFYALLSWDGDLPDNYQSFLYFNLATLSIPFLFLGSILYASSTRHKSSEKLHQRIFFLILFASITTLGLFVAAGFNHWFNYSLLSIQIIETFFQLNALLVLTYIFVTKGFSSLSFFEIQENKPAPVSNILLTVSIAAFIVIAFISRMATYSEAFERDLMVYMTIADRMLDGWPLYSVLWDHKPPAIHWTYAAFSAIFGSSPLAMFMLGFTAFLVTLFGCYYAGKAVGGKLAGLIAAGVWTLTSGDLYIQANQPNVEVFINCCLVWAIALILNNPRSMKTARYALIGLLFFLASLYKTIAAVVAILVICSHAAVRANTVDTQRSSLIAKIKPILIVGITGLVGWIVIGALFWLNGNWEPFWMAVFEYNRSYAGGMLGNLAVSLSFATHPYYVHTYVWLLLASLLFLVYKLFQSKQEKHQALILLAYFVGVWIATALPGKFYAHYYQLFLPTLAIALGWLGASMSAPNNIVGKLIFISLLIFPLSIRIFQSFIPVDEVPIVKYQEHGQESLETRSMAKWINQNYAKDAVIYHWGAEPGVYFWSQRLAPYGFVYDYPLFGNTELSNKYIQMLITALEKKPPTLIVANTTHLALYQHPVVKWIQENYQKIPGPKDIKHYIFLAPKTDSK